MSFLLSPAPSVAACAPHWRRCSRKWAAGVLLVLLVTTVTRGEIEFSAYLKSEGVMKFALGDSAARKKAEWLTFGGVFDGYTVIGFDAKKELLSVEKAGLTTQLPLKPGAVQRAAQTDQMQESPSYALGPQLDERRRIEQALDGERQSAVRRKSELDNLLDRVGGSSVGTSAAESARAVRVGDPGRSSGRRGSESVPLTAFTFRRDSYDTDPATSATGPAPSRIVIAPVQLPSSPAEPGFPTFEVNRLRELEMRRVQSLPEAERQVAISALEARILRWKQESEQPRTQAPIVTRLDIPEWERPDYMLRSYRERLQDLRTRYSEDHEWIQSYKASIEEMERAQQGLLPREPVQLDKGSRK